MVKRKKLEQDMGTEGRFIVALPNVNMDVPEYGRIKLRGGRVATTSGGAVSQYVMARFRDDELTGKRILANLRDRYGGAESYAMRLPDVYGIEGEKPLRGDDQRIAEEIEVCMYFARCYGGDARKYLDEARRILEPLNKIRRRMNSQE